MVEKILENVELVLSNTGHWHLRGNIYNDSRFEDGMPVITSRIVDVFSDGKDLYVSTKTGGSSYFIKDYKTTLKEDDIKILQSTVFEIDYDVLARSKRRLV